MANVNIDLDAVKKRLASLKKTKKTSDYLWKPTEEEQSIRIVPYKFQPGNPFLELYFHYDFNGKTYLSPLSYGEPDPINEAAQEYKNTGDKENWKFGKKLEPKLRTFAPVIVRGKEREGVKFWGFGKTIYESILSHIADDDYGDITDPITGRDIIVWTEKESGVAFAIPKIRVKPTQTRAVPENDKELLAKIFDQTDFKELYELKTYEELEVILEQYLNPKTEEETEETDNETSDESKEETSNSTDETPKNSNDVSNDFSKLFESA